MTGECATIVKPMKRRILLLTTGGVCLIIVIIVIFVFIKPFQKPKPQSPIQALKPDVLAMMEKSQKEKDQAQKLLSQNNITEKDQENAQLLLSEALADAKKATDMQPNNPITWYILSQEYRQIINVNPKAAGLAEDALKKAIQLNPNNSKLYQDLATIYIIEKRYSDAQAALEKAIGLDSKDPNGYFKMGNVYKALGQKTFAKRYYLEAKNLTPKNNQTANTLIDYEIKSLDK